MMKIWIPLYLSLVVCGYGFAMIGPWWLSLLPAVVLSAWWTGGRKEYVSRRANKDTHAHYRLSAFAGFLVSGLALMSVWLGAAFLIADQDSTGLVAKVGSLFGESLPLLANVSASALVFNIIGVLSFLLGGLAGYAGVRLRH